MSREYSGEYICNAENGVGGPVRESMELNVLCEAYNYSGIDKIIVDLSLIDTECRKSLECFMFTKHTSISNARK